MKRRDDLQTRQDSSASIARRASRGGPSEETPSRRAGSSCRARAGGSLGSGSRRDRGSVAIILVLSLMVIVITLSLVSLSLNDVGVRHTGAVQQDVDMTFVTTAALNHAWSEIDDGVDHDGDGHVGSIAPRAFQSSQGRVIAEYATWVVNLAGNPATDAPRYVLRVVVGAPTLASPTVTRTAQAAVTFEVEFALNPGVGAISISGPLHGTGTTTGGDARFHNWLGEDFSVNGTDPGPDGLFGPQPGPNGILGDADDVNDDRGYPAVVFTDAASQDAFVQSMGATLFDDVEDNFTGEPMNEFELGGDDVQAPFALQSDAAFTAEMLNSYRDSLREYAEGLVHATPTGVGTTNHTATIDRGTIDANGVSSNGFLVLDKHPLVKNGAGTGKPRFNGDVDLGSTPQTVLLDSSAFFGGAENVASNHGDSGGSTLKGKGTLVIMHPVGSKTDNTNGKMFNLDWDGDVIIVGYPKDRSTGVGNNSPTDNMLYLSRADWDVKGNLVVVTAGATEASLELGGSSDAANLTVEGSLLMFAEASGQEVDLELEANASVTVNGLIGLYGSRVEFENANQSTTSFQVNGTMAIGLPAGNTRTGDLELDFKGQTSFGFNLANVESAVASLAALQGKLNLTDDELQSLDFTTRSTLLREAMDRAVFDALRAEATSLTPRGVDRALIEQNTQ